MPGMIQPERELEFHADGTCTATVKSFFSGKAHTRKLAMTRAQYDAWQAGDYIQRALANLTPDEREFLLTGATPEEWDVEFHAEEDATYQGRVVAHPPTFNEYAVSVLIAGETAEPLDPRYDLRNHSPDGFCWGYTGSGPAQLALALLADAVGSDVALKLYQRFKDAEVARWPQNRDWTYTRSQARAWAKGQLEALDIEKR